ncbi:MAG TPA: hypothetical protein VFP10_03560 [Candidatus Eisenbacteria bacterium]|nr:hypothetical protein [Candidatus Eisenbacteria bacterium]
MVVPFKNTQEGDTDMGYQEMVDWLSVYFATNGTLSDVVAFSQAVLNHDTPVLRTLLNIAQGSI